MFDKKRFKAQMILAGVTMKDLAEELGVDESTMYRKINLDGNFTREQINKLVQVLRLILQWIFFLLKNLRKRKLSEVIAWQGNQQHGHISRSTNCRKCTTGVRQQ